MRTDFSDFMNQQFYIWGKGRLYSRYKKFIDCLNIKGTIDNNPEKWNFTNDCGADQCISPDQTDASIPVIVAVEDPVEVSKIADLLNRRNVSWCHIRQMVDSIFLSRFEDEIERSDEKDVKISRFIDVMVPVANCNFKCRYCYLTQLNTDYEHLPSIYHSERYIRYCLRRERLGGTALINLCGIGETFLCDSLIPIVKELIKEGHFIQIVTNATVKNKMLLLTDSEINTDHLFIKCSLHWKQLKERGLLSQYADTINALKRRGVSFSVELVPEDDIVNQIPEIKKYCMDSFGALPHVTVTRNENYDDYRIDTNMSEQEYKKTWSTFESALFDFKMNNRRKVCECCAGLWAAELNLATGDLYKCTNNPWIYNIYENPEEDIPFEKVGSNCKLPFCFNNHAYLTLGLAPSIEAPVYLEMRDRTTMDGQHWVVGNVRRIFGQKLYINNQ